MDQAPEPAPIRSYACKRDLDLAPLVLEGDWGGGDLGVIIPVARGALSADEAISFASLLHFARDVPKIILKKAGVELAFDTADCRVVEAPAPWMASLSAYNALMMETAFYEKASTYCHILIFQMDCLLLGRDFQRFIEPDLSYWGAPYFRRNGQLKSVGNGGFSLRSPAQCLSVLRSRRLHPGRISGVMWRQYLKGAYGRIWTRYASLRAKSGAPTLGQDFCDLFPRAEDEFWIFYAPAFSPDFRLPSALAATAFAAESQGRRVMELNGGQPPLGVHAWARHDRALWLSVMQDMGLMRDGAFTA